MNAKKPSDIFQERLRSARDGLRRMGQVELERAAGLPPNSIARFEEGARKPSFDDLRKLAIALNVTIDYLLGGVESPGLARAADPLYRHGARLTEANRSLAEDFLCMLAESDGEGAVPEESTVAGSALKQFIRRAESGEAVRVTRRGKPVAVLLSKEEYERLEAEESNPDFWEMIENWRAQTDFGWAELTPEEVDGWRDRGPGREFSWPD